MICCKGEHSFIAATGLIHWYKSGTIKWSDRADALARGIIEPDTKLSRNAQNPRFSCAGQGKPAKKAVSKLLTHAQREELKSLAALHDDAIDTSDALRSTGGSRVAR